VAKLQAPNLLLVNASVVTMDDSNVSATSVLISGDKISAVGGPEMAAALRPFARVIDLQGACVIPGFVDTHCHLRGLGQTLRQIDCSANYANSIPALVSLLKNKRPISGWIIARGYDQSRLLELRHPLASDLDSVSLEQIVVVFHSSGHGCTVNSVALRRAGICASTLDPPGGKIDRCSDGSPTGILTENAIRLVMDLQPPLTKESRAESFAIGSNYAASHGITSTTEAQADVEDIEALQICCDRYQLKVRCSLWILADQLRAKNCPAPPDLGSEKLHPLMTVDTAKIFADGAIGTRTALLREQYDDDPTNCGTSIWSVDDLNDLVLGAAQSGWRIACHAIGDLATDRVLDSYAGLTAEQRIGRRHRIEHAMLLHDDQIARLKSLQVHPVFQPEFVASFGDMYRDAVGKRANRIKPYRDIIDAGFRLSFSSDMPVVHGSPLVGIAAAVLRKTKAGVVLGEEQCVSVAEGLAAYTSGAAYAECAENTKGKIRSGMMADLAILSKNPLEVSVECWEQIETVATIVGGDFTFNPHELTAY
jgi:predicted amidohydrolase YtcJ